MHSISVCTNCKRKTKKIVCKLQSSLDLPIFKCAECGCNNVSDVAYAVWLRTASPLSRGPHFLKYDESCLQALREPTVRSGVKNACVKSKGVLFVTAVKCY